jgi:hypothetical protein
MPTIWNILASPTYRRKSERRRNVRALIALCVALIACAGCHAAHRQGSDDTVKSVADFRRAVVGSWCLPIPDNHRILGATINSSGQYVLSYSAAPATDQRGWIESAQGTIVYGKGISAIDRSTYYFAHLVHTAVNFGVSAGASKSAIDTAGIPVLINEAGVGRDNNRSRYWTRNCRIPESKS